MGGVDLVHVDFFIWQFTLYKYVVYYKLHTRVYVGPEHVPINCMGID